MSLTAARNTIHMSQYLNLKPVEYSNLSAKAQAAIKWEGRYLLPKWDGCMCLIGFFDGKPGFILSRDGKPVRSMEHIYDDLLRRWPSIATSKGGVCFIGEAWIPGAAFKDISGTFRRHSAQPALHYAVFDLVNYGKEADNGEPKLWSEWPYSKRLGWLRHFIDQTTGGSAFFVHPQVCEDEAHAMRYAKNLKALGGYDGCIASDPDATYTPGSGSSGEFLKVKPLQSFSLEVVGVAASTGEKTGRVAAALQVRFKGGVCGVGTGFDNATAAAWVADPENVVGTVAEIECMGVYDGPNGMMREPRFVGFRHDAKADY